MFSHSGTTAMTNYRTFSDAELAARALTLLGNIPQDLAGELAYRLGRSTGYTGNLNQGGTDVHKKGRIVERQGGFREADKGTGERTGSLIVPTGGGDGSQRDFLKQATFGMRYGGTITGRMSFNNPSPDHLPREVPRVRK